MKEAKLSNLQMGFLFFGFLYGTLTIVNPALTAKRDAWLAIILGTLGGFLLLTMYLFISKLNPGKTLTEILEDCFGKAAGKAISALFVWLFLHKAAMNLRGFGDFLALTSYNKTPLIVLIVFFMLGVFFCIRNGLDTIGRIGEILVPFIPIPIILISISLVSMHTFTGLQPVLLEIGPVIKSVIGIMQIPYGDTIAFLMIFPYTNKEKGRFKAVYISIIAFFFLYMTITVRNLLIVGPVLIDYVTNTPHLAAQLLPGFNIEILVDVNLMLGGGIKIGLFLYAATKATAEIFKIKNYTPLFPAFALFLIVLSIWIFPNYLELDKWVRSPYGSIYSAPFYYIIPAIMLIISLIRHGKSRSDVRGMSG